MPDDESRGRAAARDWFYNASPFEDRVAFYAALIEGKGSMDDSIENAYRQAIGGPLSDDDAFAEGFMLELMERAVRFLDEETPRH